MGIQTVTLGFLKLDIPAHWDYEACPREEDEYILRLAKAGTYHTGTIEIRARRYKWSQAPRVTMSNLLKV
jgi:hypothetical protein